MLETGFEGIMKFEFRLIKSYGRNRYYPVSENAIQLLKVVDRVCLGEEAYDYLKASGWPISSVIEVSKGWTLSQTEHP